MVPAKQSLERAGWCVDDAADISLVDVRVDIRCTVRDRVYFPAGDPLNGKLREEHQREPVLPVYGQHTAPERQARSVRTGD